MDLLLLTDADIRSTAGNIFAHISSDNILLPSSGGGAGAIGRRIHWSGWLGESIFDRDFRTWTKEGWSAFESWCDRAAPTLAARHARICFRPHPRHILADPQSCLSFLRKREGQPFELLLAPTAFLTPAMLPRAEEHLARAVDSLVTHPAVPAILIHNVAASSDPDIFNPSPLHSGLLTEGLIHRMIAGIGREKPLVLLDREFEQQRALLG